MLPLGILRTVMSHLVTAANRECLHVSAGFESFGHVPVWLSCSAESWSVQVLVQEAPGLVWGFVFQTGTGEFSLLSEMAVALCSQHFVLKHF